MTDGTQGEMVTGSNSLISETASALENKIINGDFVSGDRLTEKSLMEQFGVSRGTIRDVLRRLENVGLVELHENRGAFVRKHSFKEVLEIFDLRCELTGYAARLVAETGNDEITAELRALHLEMGTCVDANDIKTYYKKNIAFHDVLMRGSGNQRAADLYAQLVREAHLHRPMQFSSLLALKRSHSQHNAIIEALEEGSATRAETLARAHVAAGKQRFIASFGMSNT